MRKISNQKKLCKEKTKQTTDYSSRSFMTIAAPSSPLCCLFFERPILYWKNKFTITLTLDNSKIQTNFKNHQTFCRTVASSPSSMQHHMITVTEMINTIAKYTSKMDIFLKIHEFSVKLRRNWICNLFPFFCWHDKYDRSTKIIDESEFLLEINHFYFFYIFLINFLKIFFTCD